MPPSFLQESSMHVSAATAATVVKDADGDNDASVIVAAKGLTQMKQDGANAVALIQAAHAPPPSGPRGQNVNELA
jgi:hypothetical protein